MDWFMLLLSPFLVMFVYPALFLVAMYITAIFLHVYRHRRQQIYTAVSELHFWEGAQQTVAAFFDAHGTYWHGYELIGSEKLPKKGPALLIYYHGALPLDMYYILARLYLLTKRRLRNVAATFLFHFPGLLILLDVFGAVEGRTREQCVRILKNGEMLAISPGGVREALFSDESYKMIWNGRKGFAKVALEAKVAKSHLTHGASVRPENAVAYSAGDEGQKPIYPVFTQNVREAIRAVKTGRRFLRWLYEWTKLPLVPLYGGFPVKLRTFIGDPIPYDPNLSHTELADKVQLEIQNMIEKHQRVPGSVILALRERWKLEG